MENALIVKTADGRDWRIFVLDTFTVDAYPNKEYVSYTFGEFENNDDIKSYISVLNETENYFSLESMENEEEKKIVEEAYKDMLFEGVDS